MRHSLLRAPAEVKMKKNSERLPNVVAFCSLRWRKTRLVAHQELMLWRDVRRMRPGGEGACVTTLLEMPFGPREKASDAMRDLVVSPAMGVSTVEPGVVWTRE